MLEESSEEFGFEEVNKNNKLPEECVAKVDFGDYNRIGLEKLSTKEKLVISLHRPYIHIDKIRKTKRPNDERQYGLKSNSISFPQNSGTIIVEDLIKSVKNAEAIMTSAVLQFVGSKDEVDFLASKCFGSSIMKLRPYVVLQWLKVLSYTNPFYFKYREDINSINIDDLKNHLKLELQN